MPDLQWSIANGFGGGAYRKTNLSACRSESIYVMSYEYGESLVMNRKLRRIALIIALLSLLLVSLVPATAQTASEAVPTIIVRSVTQAERPIEYETTRLVVENMRELGLDVEHRAVPWAQLIDEIWYTRTGDDAWEMTYWRMVGRPERSDPDEFTYNLFHSSVRDGGYNFVGYNNAEYDALAEAQRVEVADKEARLELICEAQQIIRNDMVNAYFVHPLTPQVVNIDVFDANSVVTQAGIAYTTSGPGLELIRLATKRRWSPRRLPS